MHYQEHKPSALLRPYVECYWHYRTEKLSKEVIPVQRCLPIGTIEIIVQIDHRPCLINTNGNWETSPTCYFTGLFTNTALWQAAADSFMFGIRLKPESLIELFGIPAIYLFNNVVDAEDVLGRSAKEMYNEMTGVFEFEQLATMAEKHLLKRVYNLLQGHNLVANACRIIRKSKGTLTVEEVSNSLYVNKRKLQRDFKEQFGTSPKTYQRIVRFRHAYQYARSSKAPDIKWADVSYEAGYADQAHFIREFKEFTGVAPSALAINSDLFFQTLEASRLSLNN